MIPPWAWHHRTQLVSDLWCPWWVLATPLHRCRWTLLALDTIGSSQVHRIKEASRTALFTYKHHEDLEAAFPTEGTAFEIQPKGDNCEGLAPRHVGQTDKTATVTIPDLCSPKYAHLIQNVHQFFFPCSFEFLSLPPSQPSGLPKQGSGNSYLHRESHQWSQMQDGAAIALCSGQTTWKFFCFPDEGEIPCSSSQRE